MQPRGIRNANPGKLRHGRPWQGRRATQTDPDFVQFTSPEYGIRAMAKVLQRYQDVYGLNTISAWIARWAQPSENNTETYIRAVAQAVDVAPEVQVDFHDATTAIAVVKAIIQHENGIQPYSDEVIESGLKQAF